MIRFFAAHPTAANLIMLAVLAIGIASIPTVKRETFPDIPPDEVQVRVVYPGATAEDVEEAVCRRIEDAVEKVNDVEEIRCESRENQGTAVVGMIEGRDFARFFSEIRTEVEAIDGFPDEAEVPIVRQLGLTDFVAAVAVSGPMSPTDLKTYTESLKERMLAVPAISQVKVTGFSDRQIRIEVPSATLRRYGLGIDSIAETIASQNLDLPAGTIETRASDVLVRFNDMRRSPLEFHELVVVGAASGAEIRLGDIARITDRFELAEDKIVFNGRRAAVLEIAKTMDQDSLDVVAALKTFLEDERRRMPAAMQFEITRDLSSVVDDRLTMIARNGGQGLVLVFLTLWAFFSLRFSFWVAMGFPISFAASIFIMSQFGLSFDMITLVGLLIAIGLLVDDAIVIAENIAAHHLRGSPPLKAAIDGTREVAPGVIASYFTTLCVIGSLAFLKGDIGSILKWMPIVLIVTLTVSLVEAFLILPHHIFRSLSRHDPTHRPWLRNKIDGAANWLRDVALARAIAWALAWRYFTVGLAFAVFLASLSMVAGGDLKFIAFPDVEGDVAEARLLMPQGTPLGRSAAVVEGLVAAVNEVNAEYSPSQPGGRDLVESINVQFNKNVDAHEAGPHVATVTVDLLSTEIRRTRLDDFLNRWRERAGHPLNVISLNFTAPMIGPAGRDIDIELRGQDLDRLKQASREMLSWLDRYDGVNDLTDDLRPGKPELLVRLRDGATSLGLSARTIAAQLRAAFHGRTVGEIQIGKESYEIDVRLAVDDRDSLGDLEYFSVTAANGAQIPLGAVASLDAGRGFARINRIDNRRAVTIQGNVDGSKANSGEILRNTRALFLPDLQARYPDIEVVFKGQAESASRTGGSIAGGFVIGLVGVFLLLSFLFRSYIEPIVVMITIPLGLIGVVWGHWALGLDLSMPSMVGFASLAGVVVNNAILMVEFIKIQRRRGNDVTTAARTAAQLRFRAILLTSATTIMGLLPLLTEKSLQAQVLVPLVASVAFGLLAATFLILFLLPALYAILDDFGLTAKLEANGGDGKKEPVPLPL